MSSSVSVSVPALLRILRTRLTPGDSSKSILPFVPRPLKWLVLLVLLVNVRGLPFFWTVRVFRPALYVRAKYRFLSLFESRSQLRTRLTAGSSINANPFDLETVFTTRATPDVSDFNWHLSNSSYAMSYDMIRFKWYVQYMPLFFRDGGWVALGATHYSFVREIPMNARFEIRLSVASWDHKWIYMVARYVTYGSKKSKKLAPGQHRTDGATLAFPPAVTPIDSATPSPSRSPGPTIEPIGLPLPPGATLHCTAVSRLCCKIGRITIPPPVAMATSGFSISHERYEEIQDWRFKDGGKRIKKFYSGGWRDVPEGERWWEDAFGGDIERRRVEGLKGLAPSVGLPVPGQ